MRCIYNMFVDTSSWQMLGDIKKAQLTRVNEFNEVLENGWILFRKAHIALCSFFEA